MKKTIFTLAIAFMTVLISGAIAPYSASAESNGEIMFMLDASSSMLAKDGTSTTRIDKAKDALRQTIAGLPADTKVGLRVYGSQQSDANSNKGPGCQDSHLVSSPRANNAASIASSLNDVQAKGWTLMGKSLQDVQKDFTGSGPKSVILLSDGIDTCTPPDACDVAKSLQANGTKVKVNTLGLLVNNAARAQLTCIAQGSGGDYYDINSLDRLQATLGSLTTREVSLFTAQGTPIKGSLRSEEAPLMLANTFYTDTITVPQELYYGFEALPKQKITVTIKGIGRDTPLRNVDFLELVGYKQATTEKLKEFASNQRFGVADVATVTYEVDTAREKIDKPTQLAFKVTIDPNNTSNVTGVAVPLEIRVTTEGGVSPNNQSDEANSLGAADASDDEPMSPLVIVLLTLLGVAVLAGAGYGAKKYLDKRRKAQATTYASVAEPPTASEQSSDNNPQQ